jgi:penicillin V acylase-like amidase (Ntn superfamily)
MCSRVLLTGESGVVVTGRSMDWMTPTGTNLWVLPAGAERDGATAARPFAWTARHGSVVASMYDIATVEGVNDAGLAAHALYLDSSRYPVRDASFPGMSMSVWTQYVLDSFATVAEAVAVLADPPFQVRPITLPDGTPAPGHLALSDRTGDSAVVEYIDGRPVVHHGPAYRVMTNDPPYDAQLALSAYWEQIGGGAMLPGTERPADRFVRAGYYLSQCAPTADGDSAMAAVFAIVRNVSVPMIASGPDAPNVAPTNWRSGVDHRELRYFWESTWQPNVFWVELARIDLSAGAPVRRLVAEDGPTRNGDCSHEFEPAEPFAFLVA